MPFVGFHYKPGTFFYAKFHSYALTVYSDCVLEFPILFSFLANSLMSSMYIRRFIFSCDKVKLYLALYFLRMWLSGIITIINSNSDSSSPWNIHLWIFVSAKLFPPAVKFYSPGFHGFLDRFYDFIRYFVQFETFYYPALCDISYAFL